MVNILTISFLKIIIDNYQLYYITSLFPLMISMLLTISSTISQKKERERVKRFINESTKLLMIN